MLDDTVIEDVRRALEEDMGRGDLTAELIDDSVRACAYVVTREPAVLCGRAWFDEVFKQLPGEVSIEWLHQDGDLLAADSRICMLSGPARTLLSGERTALNFLQTLSGTATLTARYVAALESTTTVLLDTRKTIPGLRLAQKYAVRCGGGRNHRMGLYDEILIKENHIVACGGISQAIAKARALHGPNIPVEVEVEGLDELAEALSGGADKVLLDNFGQALMVQAVGLRDKSSPGTKLEVSGGVGLSDIREIAQTGVDYISVGALTKNLQAVDLSMRFYSGWDKVP
ncbi:MAG: carboxylating nicotinate-nucleotide diphosphorylase [Gammaproteobacteria bacterium]|nr:carboxylating nicotinate-nucleotide diphosphorylase [Gammaproteobacteria bacterium]